MTIQKTADGREHDVRLVMKETGMHLDCITHDTSFWTGSSDRHLRDSCRTALMLERDRIAEILGTKGLSKV